MRFKRWASWAGAALVAVGGMTLGASPAQAFVPDRFGFVLFSGGVISEATPAGTTVANVALGRWQIRFPGQGIAGGVVHVTAVHNALAAPPGRWCQADAWGVAAPDEIVRISCYRPGGVLDNTPGFSVLFTRSSGVVGGGFYGYVDSTAAGAIVSQFNSVGNANGVFHAGIGQYSVSFPGLGTPGPNDGSLQVTAVNPGVGARCKVAGWSSTPNGQFVRIFCHNGAGALLDTRFTVSYQFRRSHYGPAFPPNRFGYLWNVPPLGPPSTNFNSSGVANVLAGVNPFGATFPNIALAPGNLQVTAYGVNSNFCNLLAPWSNGGGHVSVRIMCFTNAGGPAPAASSGFFAAYSSRF